MSKKRFAIEFTVDMEITLDQKVLDQVDEEWKKVFYKLNDDRDVAKMIAYNYLMNNATLSQLDGFANLTDNLVDYGHCEVEDSTVYWTGDIKHE